MTTDQKTDNQGDKLYAGKFKTVEELETGYKNSLPAFQENENLKKKLDEVTKIPDDYQTPSEIALHEADLAEAKRVAKAAGMTQVQYDKYVREQNAKSKSKADTFEKAKGEIGADGLNVLQDYVKNYYPAKSQDAALKHLIMDKDARSEALAHRQSLLDNKAPGMSGTSYGAHRVTHQDVMKARDEMNGSRGRARIENQKRYLRLQKQLAHQNDS